MFESGSEGRTAQQCAVLTRLVSPVLSNIYLHKLDEFVERELIRSTRGESTGHRTLSTRK